VIRDPLEELRALYAEVDARYAGWSCDASTRCCRFGVTGREPYVTAVELEELRAAIARSGRRLGRATSTRGAARAGRRRLALVDEGRCGLLTDGGRCAVYESRPLGCRTFHCADASAGAPVRQREINAWVARVRSMSARFTPGGDLGRPLSRVLRAAAWGSEHC
jgi:Fe-S-cluster containining protein